MKNIIALFIILSCMIASGCKPIVGTGFIQPEDYKYAEQICNVTDGGLKDVTAYGDIRAPKISDAYGSLIIHCNNGRTFTVGKWKD